MITILEKGEKVKVDHEGQCWFLPIHEVVIDGCGEAWYKFQINPSNCFSVKASRIQTHQYTDELLKCMVDMHANAEDVLWVNSGETLWERMASIYEKHGGDMGALKAKFPQYF